VPRKQLLLSMTLKLKAENWWLTNLNQNNTWNTLVC
jgi:hypothetical protein